ncbi:hypothetical protein GH714_025364 [Hevea brasiliensis]|uniref:ABC transporter domain-containing protein n=1 Tax=Hevea brasiliensis TaxID=3981 RepID=A0A6A6MKQ9_HEVBR|nr:hypothetical protein GH714_025364 [Hevea brasiliensis]
MESDLHGAGSTLQRGNSWTWSNATKIVSGSCRSQEDDDEEALKWAALEKLPTYDRLKNGLLTTSDGRVTEINVQNIGLQERKNLLDRLVKVAEEDNEKFLLKLRNRIDRVGIQVPTTEVRFEQLNVEVESYVGSRALPTFFNYSANIVEGLLNFVHILSSKKKRLHILKDASGIIKPSRMTLLLGPPSSGKTTFLLALAGKLDPAMKFSGRVTYNGHDMNDFVPQRTAAYISQHDLHAGEMTVRETLAFSARCQGAGTRYDMLAELSRREKAMNIKPDPDIDIFMKATSTDGQQASMVTDYILRLLGLEVCADTMVGDEMLRGISGGQRKRVTIGEMLVGPAKVTSRKDQKQYWARRDVPYRFVTANDFAEAFQSFSVGRRLGDELAIPFDKAKSHRAALTTRKYGISKKELCKACFSREFLLMKRNSFFYIFKFCQSITVALISMSLFLRTEMHRDSVTDGEIYVGAMAYIVTFIVFNEVAVMVFITYYAIGFDPNVGRLFRQCLVLVIANQMASGLFRSIAAASRNMFVANNFGSFVLLLIFTLSGFVLSRGWAWGYWMSPMMYGQNAVVVNEFLGKSWSHVLPSSTEPLGVEVLKSRGFFTQSYWYWLGVGALLVFTLVYNFLYVAALTLFNPSDNHQPVISEEPPDHEHGRKGGTIPTKPKRDEKQGVHEDKLVLLKGVSGVFRPGILTALMGVSGAGKTTLMDVLAGRKIGGYIEGNITVSGYKKKQETFARISGYCEQNDIHSPHVTVYESLVYSAWLRLPREVDAETRKIFIEEVMELLELNSLRQALVGSPGVNHMSIEQRKRLTIAVELVANPSIIFMDEPTSGLDARAAALVMRTVRNTVDTGRTVVCTIHQPSIDIFESFDEVRKVISFVAIPVEAGRRRVYVGPLGCHSCHLIKYFEGIEGVSKIKDGYNPATWMLEVTTQAQEVTLGVDFADIYKNSELYRRNKELIKELSKPAPGSRDLYFSTQYSQSFLTQCLACLWKQHRSYWRNPPYTAVRLLFTTFTGLILGTMFWDLGSKTTKRQNLFNAMGSMFDAVMFLGTQNGSTVMPVVAIERTVFYRERASGMYSAFPYAFAQVAIEIPYIFVQAAVYGVIIYTMIGFEWTASKFFWYLFFTFFSFLHFTFYGMMAMALSPNQHFASTINVAVYGMWNLFSGFMIPQPRIPVWWKWYYWICPVAWTLNGLITSQYGDLKHKLETGETVEHFLREYFGFNHDFLGAVAALVIGFAVLFAVSFAVSIKVFNFQRR